MPVRIYDIAKKLGLENKEVLSKAKDLGISAARVPSSSLDKITAEFLEQHLASLKSPAAEPVEPPTPPPTPEPIILVSEPKDAPAPILIAPEPVAPSPLPVPEIIHIAPPPVEEPIQVEAAPVELPTITEVAAPVEAVAVVAEAAVADAPAAPAPLPPPPIPAGPKVGDKVGFIQLPTKPGPRTGDRVGTVKLPPPRGGGPPPRQDFNRGRNDFRGQQRQPYTPGARPGLRPEPKPGASLPDTAEVITLKPPVIVRDLAERLKRKPFQIIADLMELKVLVTVNQPIDELTAQKLCAKYGFRFESEKRERGGGIVHAPKEVVQVDIEDKPEDLLPRAPIVTIMGHVDHGKTTLLDVIRKADVAAGEAGGITQHIGAYTISFPHPEKKEQVQQITFLDTPGHAAFSAMRARGANVTDIVVLVVAANDGVMPQTLEALSHAQAAKVPIIVAVNKVDHPNANPMKVRQQLQERGLVCEEWGGTTIFCDVSAVAKTGIEKLLEMILLQAEVLELKANPKRTAKGNVIESGLQPGGPTATVLVRKGTLKVGETVVCGEYYGKVRALINEEGKRLKEASPSTAVRLLGLNGVPEAGLEFAVIEDEKSARGLVEQRIQLNREMSMDNRTKVTLENLFATLANSNAKILKLVVKADMQGSVEAIVEALKKMPMDKVAVNVIHFAVGTVTESDVLLASASNAVILGFHTRIDNGVAEVAKREGVQIKLYSIIYELIDQVKEAMAGLLDPILKDVVVGSAEVRQLFDLSKGGTVAGCVVTMGRLVKGKVRIMRRKNLIYEGIVTSLRRFQDEVNEVRSGMECGIRIDGFNEFQPGDTIEAFTVEKVIPKL